MYLFKSASRYLRLITCALTGAALLAACKPAGTKNASPAYFDIGGYFKSEAARLARQNQPVLKTIVHNGVSETKKVTIKDWKQELNMFIQADINKPAWKDSYTVQRTENTIVYKAKADQADNLDVRDIIINKKDGEVKWILIFTHTPKNMLYETKAKLSWFPDSAYQVQKTQTVKLLGKNSYDISGKFNQ